MGADLALGAVVGLASLASVPHSRQLQDAQVLGDRGLRDAEESVSTRTVRSPPRLSRSKMARRVGSASALKTASGAVRMDES